MVNSKATDNKPTEDEELGSVQAPQEGEPTGQLAEPVSDKAPADAAEAPAPSESDHQEDDNPEASEQPGEAKGKATPEQDAAEEEPTDDHDNPVGEETASEPNSDEGHKDPYAEGKHIKNPEPNNGADSDKDEE